LSLAYVGTGLALAVALLAGRGVIESVFGPTYEGLSSVVAMLALLPLLRSVGNVLAEPLTGGGRHRVRVLVLGAGLAVNVVVNVTLLDSLGWRAAVWGTYASEGTQLILLLAIALAARRPAGATLRRFSSVGDARQ
jgi:O-antigen/teichoic acid export membrane protein